MKNPFSRLLAVLAGSRQSDLRRQVQFLRAENQILRSKLRPHVRTTPQERARLVRLGRPLGRSIKEFLTIVTPQTFTRWVNREDRKTARPRRSRRPLRRRGRPRTAKQVRALLLRLARETDWGYIRLQGELRKLGVRLSKGTIANILKEEGVPRSPSRREGTWDQFLKMHAQSLWACDFVSKRIWTKSGLVQAFMLLFIHVHSRRLIVSPCTTEPDRHWTMEQTQRFIEQAKTLYRPPTSAEGLRGPEGVGVLIHDRDKKFCAEFRYVLRSAGVRDVPIRIHTPNMNAHAERVIQTLKHECLDRFIVMGTEHLDHLTSEFTRHYNLERPHSRLGMRTPLASNETIAPWTVPREKAAANVVCRERLGGLLRHYVRLAA